jgi:hypothetical protein
MEKPSSGALNKAEFYVAELLIPSPLLFRWNQLVLSAMGVVVIPRVIFRV